MLIFFVDVCLTDHIQVLAPSKAQCTFEGARIPSKPMPRSRRRNSTCTKYPLKGVIDCTCNVGQNTRSFLALERDGPGYLIICLQIGYPYVGKKVLYSHRIFDVLPQIGWTLCEDRLHAWKILKCCSKLDAQTSDNSKIDCTYREVWWHLCKYRLGAWGTLTCCSRLSTQPFDTFAKIDSTHGEIVMFSSRSTTYRTSLCPSFNVAARSSHLILNLEEERYDYAVCCAVVQLVVAQVELNNILVLWFHVCVLELRTGSKFRTSDKLQMNNLNLIFHNRRRQQWLPASQFWFRFQLESSWRLRWFIIHQRNCAPIFGVNSQIRDDWSEFERKGKRCP